MTLLDKNKRSSNEPNLILSHNIAVLSVAMKEFLTEELNAKKYHNKMQEISVYAGFCHTVSASLYLLFGYKNIHLYRIKVFDEYLQQDDWHWYLKRRDNDERIDLTKEQYKNQTIDYSTEEKSSMLGFAYRKRAKELAQLLRDKFGFRYESALKENTFKIEGKFALSISDKEEIRKILND